MRNTDFSRKALKLMFKILWQNVWFSKITKDRKSIPRYSRIIINTDSTLGTSLNGLYHRSNKLWRKECVVNIKYNNNNKNKGHKLTKGYNPSPPWLVNAYKYIITRLIVELNHSVITNYILLILYGFQLIILLMLDNS